MSDLDVLHPHKLGDIAEKAAAINCEAKAVRVDVRRPQSSEDNGDFPGGDRVRVQHDGPWAMRGRHLFALPKAAIDETRARFSSKLAPDFLFAGTEPFSKCVHNEFARNRDE